MVIITLSPSISLSHHRSIENNLPGWQSTFVGYYRVTKGRREKVIIKCDISSKKKKGYNFKSNTIADNFEGNFVNGDLYWINRCLKSPSSEYGYHTSLCSLLVHMALNLTFSSICVLLPTIISICGITLSRSIIFRCSPVTLPN